MRQRIVFAFACSLLFAHTASAQTERELDAHEHGHSTLNVAVEGTTVSLELEAPGSDIVGFEHAAESDADKARVAEAKAALGKPLSLFTFPSAAGCSLTNASVEIEGDDGHEGSGHTEFHATYALTCKDPAKIDVIKIPFFAQFPGAKELEVNLISDKGQRQFEVEKDAPLLDVSGLL